MAFPNGVKAGLFVKYFAEAEWKGKEDELTKRLDICWCKKTRGTLQGITWSDSVIKLLEQTGEWDYFDPAVAGKDKRKPANHHIERFRLEFGADYNVNIAKALNISDPYMPKGSESVKEKAQKTSLLLCFFFCIIFGLC